MLKRKFISLGSWTTPIWLQSIEKSKDRVHGYGVGSALLGDLGTSSFLDKKLGDMVKDKP